jgi:hypothetical protein
MIDLTGKRFGRWTVRAYAGDGKWSCLCDCGARVIVAGGHLREGSSQSCGCLRIELRRIDLTGKRFGRWIALAYVGGKYSAWSCICDCGARAIVRGTMLRAGQSRSCGCLHRELTKARFTKHGMSGTPEYNSWNAMMQRCFNPRTAGFEHYGGRGITAYEDWHSILGLFADVGPRPPGYSLDRIDVNGNYEPGNVRWADAKQQRQNQRPRRAKRAAVKRRQALKQAEPLPPPLDDPPF